MNLANLGNCTAVTDVCMSRAATAIFSDSVYIPIQFLCLIVILLLCLEAGSSSLMKEVSIVAGMFVSFIFNPLPKVKYLSVLSTQIKGEVKPETMLEQAENNP